MVQEHRSPTSSLASNLAWGAKWGLLCAAVYFPIGLAKYLLTGGSVELDVLFLTRAFVATVAVGGVVGCGVGLLRPLLSWGRWGAALMGIIVSAPLVAVAVLYGPDISIADVVGNVHLAGYFLLVSVVGGGFLGLFCYHLFADH